MNVLVFTNIGSFYSWKGITHLAYSSAVEGTSFGRTPPFCRDRCSPDAFNILILDVWSGHFLLAIGCVLVDIVKKLVHERKKLSLPVPLAGVR
jgi:hypothetical protein